MKTLVALLTILLVGCGAAVGSSADETPEAEPTQVVEAAPAAPVAPVAPAKPELWLPEGHPVKAAQDAWGLPLTHDVELVLVPGKDASIACGYEPKKGSYVGGCSEYWNYKIIIAGDLSADSRAVILIHELGHIYRQGQGHPSEGCPEGKAGAHVMCANGHANTSEGPDSVDYAFVLHEGAYEHDPVVTTAQH